MTPIASSPKLFNNPSSIATPPPSGGSEAQDRAFLLRRVVGDRQKLERGERPEDHVDLVALDQLLRLRLRTGRVAAGIGDEELGWAPGELVAAVLQEQRHALLHLEPALASGP